MEPVKTEVFTTLINQRGGKVQLVHFLAPALILTLTLNHLANKPFGPSSICSCAHAVERMRKEAVQINLWTSDVTTWSRVNLATSIGPSRWRWFTVPISSASDEDYNDNPPLKKLCVFLCMFLEFSLRTPKICLNIIHHLYLYLRLLTMK